MAVENFDKALARVLVYEGGKVDDPHDPGGRTAFGVTQKVFTAWLKSGGLPSRDVWTITKAEIGAIYRRLYWDRCKCDQLPSGVDLAIFDAAVNSGVGQAAKWAQRALGDRYPSNKINGDFGPLTVQGLTDPSNDNDLLVKGICERRLATLKTLKTWGRYGRGWSARVANVLKSGQAWATGSVGPLPVSVSLLGGDKKADVSPETVKKPLLSSAKAAIVTTASTAGSAVPQAIEQVTPFEESVPWVRYIVIGLTVIAAVAAVVTWLARNAEKNSAKAESGETETPIDEAADLSVQTPEVAINDNDPLANVRAAA